MPAQYRQPFGARDLLNLTVLTRTEAIDSQGRLEFEALLLSLLGDTYSDMTQGAGFGVGSASRWGSVLGLVWWHLIC